MMGKVLFTTFFAALWLTPLFGAEPPSSDLSYKIWENYDKVQWVKGSDGKRSVFFEFESRKEKHWIFSSAPERTPGDLELLERFVFQNNFALHKPPLSFSCTKPQVSRTTEKLKEYFYDLSQCTFSLDLILWGNDKTSSTSKSSKKKRKQ
jgi:hypothetical protein